MCPFPAAAPSQGLLVLCLFGSSFWFIALQTFGFKAGAAAETALAALAAPPSSSSVDDVLCSLVDHRILP